MTGPPRWRAAGSVSALRPCGPGIATGRDRCRNRLCGYGPCPEAVCLSPPSAWRSPRPWGLSEPPLLPSHRESMPRSCVTSRPEPGSQVLPPPAHFDVIAHWQPRPALSGAPNRASQHLRHARRAVHVLFTPPPQPQPPATLAILQLQLDYFHFIYFHDCLHCYEWFMNAPVSCGPTTAKQKALHRLLGHRARFSYDDLLELFSYDCLSRRPATACVESSPPRSRTSARGRSAPRR
jgi:hypothetical protein